MDKDKDEEKLRRLIIKSINNFCNAERIPIEDRVMAFQPMEFLIALDSKDKDRFLEIRREATNLVHEEIEDFCYSHSETVNEWKISLFGRELPEIQLSEFISEVYIDYSREQRLGVEIMRSMKRT